MPTAQRDTEITLGTGRMLALFFTFVMVCAIFFAIGFSLGRKTTYVSAGNPVNSSSEPSSAVRPTAAKQNPSQSAAQSTDFSFYKSVGAKNTDSDLVTPAVQTTSSPADAPKAPTPVSTSAATAGGGYYVQVAAVSRQEDADSLVEALKKKQYPAFTASSSPADKFFHVQVGPYSDLKEAENMRGRLIADGYNPIVKK
jgi:cell division septation protein DedD